VVITTASRRQRRALSHTRGPIGAKSSHLLAPCPTRTCAPSLAILSRLVSAPAGRSSRFPTTARKRRGSSRGQNVTCPAGFRAPRQGLLRGAAALQNMPELLLAEDPLRPHAAPGHLRQVGDCYAKTMLGLTAADVHVWASTACSARLADATTPQSATRMRIASPSNRTLTPPDASKPSSSRSRTSSACSAAPGPSLSSRCLKTRPSAARRRPRTPAMATLSTRTLCRWSVPRRWSRCSRRT
jgi:hypothetical protein